jgi:hypothetical protein
MPPVQIVRDGLPDIKRLQRGVPRLVLTLLMADRRHNLHVVGQVEGLLEIAERNAAMQDLPFLLGSSNCAFLLIRQNVVGSGDLSSTVLCGS